ncbi:GTP cyclohydrolase II [Corallincola holothuriorum]|uniref:GTP cyclohydrolase-2 n=1 Tax=Corallincola holothuriorum TaxID=2282215 RepID=A0A368NMZ2_9GAMM|nr:GTP cyclohydrolase II [Corallincola holothuriorum]RCU51778.1 GTP cyclohydrolase II [Corallincola holothuriorum]
MVEVRKAVPLKVGAAQVEAEIISFNGLESGCEHIAMRFKGTQPNSNIPLVRMHSECLTGDVFHSSRCDCGEQLNEAISLIHVEGGILLYLRQEGRGIGLYNKLDAYELQDTGLNTYEANVKLGFGEDLREFNEAAEMLKALGIDHIRLLSNNPRKTEQLKAAGISIETMVNTSVHLKPGNSDYLKAKKNHGNHQLRFS